MSKKKQKPGKDEQIKELTEDLQRLQAEFENYKKRTENQQSEQIKCATKGMVKGLLPIIDNFELALKNCREKDDFYKGMELIYSQLIDALQSQGLQPIDSEGKKFDPYMHEALMAEESKQEPNTIIEELQKGYLFNNTVLRHAKVKVAKPAKKQ